MPSNAASRTSKIYCRLMMPVVAPRDFITPISRMRSLTVKKQVIVLLTSFHFNSMLLMCADRSRYRVELDLAKASFT